MKFISYENLVLAYKNASKSRKNKKEVHEFNKNIEKNLLDILHDLQQRTYKPYPCKKFILSDSKKRYIHSPCFRDHIVHHMIYNIVYDVLDKRIVENSFATRKEKGLHKGMQYVTAKLDKYRGLQDTLYYMKIDVSKYFYSISHKLLKQKIFAYIHNPDLQYVITMVIDSYITSSLFDHLFDPVSPYRMEPKKGVPIGALYSQLFANFFLYDIDRYIVQHSKPLLYVRYMDDFIFIDTKENLLQLKGTVISLLHNNGLFVVPWKIQMNTMKHGMNLLGFRVHINADKLRLQVSKSNKKKYWKCVDNIYQLDANIFDNKDRERIQSVLASRKGLFTHTGSYEKYIIGVLFGIEK